MLQPKVLTKKLAKKKVFFPSRLSLVTFLLMGEGEGKGRRQREGQWEGLTGDTYASPTFPVTNSITNPVSNVNVSSVNVNVGAPHTNATLAVAQINTSGFCVTESPTFSDIPWGILQHYCSFNILDSAFACLNCFKAKRV